MRTDDAVGMLTLRRLDRRVGRLPHDVRVIEGGTLGLDLLDRSTGYPTYWCSMR